MKEFLEWSIALALGVGCLALNSLFTMFPKVVEVKDYLKTIV